MIPCARCRRDCEGEIGLYAGESWDPPDILVNSYRMEDAPAFCVPCAIWRAAGLFVSVARTVDLLRSLGIET
jgi:hypothetical protein